MPTNIGYYGWTVPEGTDAPAGPEQFTELANDISATVRAIDLRVATNAANLVVMGHVTALEAAVAQSIPTGGPVFTTHSLAFDTELVDTSGMHDPVTNKERLTCKVAGYWALTGGTSYASNATGRRGALWYVNGVRHSSSPFVMPATAASAPAVVAPSIIVKLNVNDYVTLAAFHEAGVALSTLASSGDRAYMTARYVAPP